MAFGGFAIQAVVLVSVFGVTCGQSACEVYSCQPSPEVPFFTLCKNYTLTTLPANISTTTKLLVINGGKIEKILAADLKGLSQLQSLTLSNNNISIIEARGFQDLMNLLTLDLSNNKITLPDQVTRPVLTGLGKLTHLNVNNNKIGAVPDFMCTDLSSLESLDANGNNIQSIGSNVFTRCKTLSHIDVANNELTTIVKDAFQNLDLSGNSLTTFYSAWLVNKSSNINLVMDNSTWHCTTQLKMEYDKMKASHPSTIGCNVQSSFCPLCANFGGKRLDNLTLEELNVPTTTASNTGTMTESSNSSTAAAINLATTTTASNTGTMTESSNSSTAAATNLATTTSNNKTTDSGSEAPTGKAGLLLTILTVFLLEL